MFIYSGNGSQVVGAAVDDLTADFAMPKLLGSNPAGAMDACVC